MSSVARQTMVKAQAVAESSLTTAGIYIDKVLPAERRSELWSNLKRFLNEHPILALFLISQLIISGPVVAMFLTVTISLALFFLFIGTMIFVFGAIGFALVFVLPTLFITSMLALSLWIWILGAFYVLRYFNTKKFSNLEVHHDFNQGTGKENGKGLEHHAGSEAIDSRELSVLKHGNGRATHGTESVASEQTATEEIRIDSNPDAAGQTVMGP